MINPYKINGISKEPVRLRLPKSQKYFLKGEAIDWSLDLPTDERQKIGPYETNSCMTYSSNNAIETYLDYLNKTGQISPSTLKRCQDLGYLDSNGRFNFSDRFSAIMNGTNPRSGNIFDTVWLSVQKYGLLPEKDFTYTDDMVSKFSKIEDFWADYFDKNQVTQAMKEKALIFNSLFRIDYSWLIAAGFNGLLLNIKAVLMNQTREDIIRNALQDSLVQLGIPVCDTWNSGDVQVCSLTNAQHGVMAYKVNDDGSILIEDSYSPFQKKLEPGYNIPYAVSVKVTPLDIKHAFNTDISFGTNSDEVKWLQRCLQALGYFKYTITGYYGPITATAVYNFQIDENVDVPEVLNELKGHNVGPKTRAALNQMFNL